jgi:hypothetical protein
VAVVVGVVVALLAEAALDDVDPVEDCPETVVGAVVVAVGPDEVAAVDPVVTEAEWATVSDATSMPRPAAPATAAIPMVAVIRRTRALARSRASSADRRSWWESSGFVAMRCPFGDRRDEVGFVSMEVVHRAGC